MTEWRSKTFDLSAGTATMTTVACLVKGVYVNNTLDANECVIKDGATGQQDKVPASAAAGKSYDFGPTRYESNVIVAPAGSQGEISVKYVILGEPHA